ncbi:uncharacterized protein F5147DRAFT_654077 [Suillus discolor]|uniref:Uncharacterized protein n=1 Tax=Suillus discolor TaxID=1912936 RepID=A0A9P7F4P6_9AGAM|nr:uncharacterized protein F5147DRAFT_654077 [Suillus discolor]KAG2105835.1 hypothetical protein F5147DRAFT_654077 [Suillus discolor]
MSTPSSLPPFNSPAIHLGMFELSNILSAPKWLEFYIRLIPSETRLGRSWRCLATSWGAVVGSAKGGIVAQYHWGQYKVPTAISVSATRRCVVARPMAYSAAAQQKCESWLRRQNTNFTSPNELFSIASDPPSNASAVDQLAHSPEQQTSVICNPSFHLCSTWVTLCVQEAFNEARKVELVAQAGLMTTYLDIEHYHSHHRDAHSELLYLRAKMLRAKAEVEVFELAIENTILSEQVHTCKERIPTGSINDHTDSTYVSSASLTSAAVQIAPYICEIPGSAPVHDDQKCSHNQQLIVIVCKLEYMATQHSQQYLVELLDCSFGIWPTQLPWYAEPVMLTNGREDHLVPMKPELYGSDWEELVHPLGGTYYYHNKQNTYTSINIRHMDRRRLEDFINVSRATAKEDEWTLVVHQVSLISLQQQPESPEHTTEATTLNQSTAATIFWTLDQMRQVDTQLASVKALAENRTIEDTGVVHCCYPFMNRMLLSQHTIGHYQYLNRHNQPEARLIRGHAVIEKPRTCKALYFMGNTAATILCMPITIDCIKNTSVDGIVNGVDVRTFIDDFTSQAKSQITLAGVSVAMDVAILAILGLGILPTKKDDDADRHYKYTDLLLHTECAKFYSWISHRFLTYIGDCKLWSGLVQDTAPVTNDIFWRVFYVSQYHY